MSTKVTEPGQETRDAPARPRRRKRRRLLGGGVALVVTGGAWLSP
jgi:hypothetical protein